MLAQLHNGVQLAKALGKSVVYVTAMKRAGYRFTHGTMTTLESAHEWLATFPQFRASHYLKPGACERLPGLELASRKCSASVTHFRVTAQR